MLNFIIAKAYCWWHTPRRRHCSFAL